MTSVSTARLCHDFWRAAGGSDPFPRDLQTAIPRALLLNVVNLSSLGVDSVERWLWERGIAGAGGPSRPLHACLVTREGYGFIFINASDAAAERRFSLAHEAGHYLLDYQEPRRQIAASLGSGAAEVLAGARRPTDGERLAAMLAGVGVAPRVHLMQRGPDGFACGDVAAAEYAADEVALELLAPEDAVLERLGRTAMGAAYAERERAAAAVLRDEFGLPEPIAGRYGRRLLRRQTGGPSLREWLGLPAAASLPVADRREREG